MCNLNERRENTHNEFELRTKVTKQRFFRAKARVAKLLARNSNEQAPLKWIRVRDTVVEFDDDVRVILGHDDARTTTTTDFDAIVERKQVLLHSTVPIPRAQCIVRASFSAETRLPNDVSLIQRTREWLTQLHADDVWRGVVQLNPPSTFHTLCRVLIGDGTSKEYRTAKSGGGSEGEQLHNNKMLQFAHDHWSRMRWVQCSSTPLCTFASMPIDHFPFAAFAITVPKQTTDELDAALQDPVNKRAIALTKRQTSDVPKMTRTRDRMSVHLDPDIRLDMTKATSHEQGVTYEVELEWCRDTVPTIDEADNMEQWMEKVLG